MHLLLYHPAERTSRFFRGCGDLEGQHGLPDNLIVDPDEPLSIARLFLSSYYDLCGVRTLHHYQAVFHAHTGGYYRELEIDDIRKELYEFLDHAMKEEDGHRERFKPRKS